MIAEKSSYFTAFESVERQYFVRFSFCMHGGDCSHLVPFSMIYVLRTLDSKISGYPDLSASLYLSTPFT